MIIAMEVVLKYNYNNNNNSNNNTFINVLIASLFLNVTYFCIKSKLISQGFPCNNTKEKPSKKGCFSECELNEHLFTS